MARKAVLLVIAMLMLAAFMLPGVASARDFRVRPKVKLEQVPGGTVHQGDRVVLAGRIKSKAVCERRRIVELFQVDPGPNTLLDTDRSDRDGEFRFTLRVHGDMAVYAHLDKLVDRRYSGRHVCRASSSQKVDINVSG